MWIALRVCCSLLTVYGILTNNESNVNPYATKCNTESNDYYQVSGRLEKWGALPSCLLSSLLNDLDR